MTTFGPDERRVALGSRGMRTASAASVAVTAASAADGEPAPVATAGVLPRRAEEPKSLPGSTSGGTSTRRERAAPGIRLNKPRLSSVLIIPLTFGGAVPKCRAMSSNEGDTPTFVV
jgi:hypothetical protein